MCGTDQVYLEKDDFVLRIFYVGTITGEINSLLFGFPHFFPKHNEGAPSIVAFH